MIQYPDLPIVAKRNELVEAIKTHQVVIIAGDTGSGKSTQIPKFCLEAGLGQQGMIAHTQPRRIAAKTIAAQLAKELQFEVGKQIALKIRFLDQAGDDSKIKILTDGMLLKECEYDRQLRQYDAIIIDEAHERNLNIDILLGFLKRLLKKRPDLKIIITSATIQHERFSTFFDGAPVFEIEGRTYPVTTQYLPDSVKTFPDDPTMQAMMGIESALSQDAGDILVFQTGEREIKDLCQELHYKYRNTVDVLPLYARLSMRKQQAIFAPSSKRKIIVATNVAETSITVPNIRFVIDNGFARVSRYSYRNKIQQLPIERIAQANALQRQGRCGRVGPGICIRLYSEEDYQSRDAFAQPEILRANLAGVLLRLTYLGIKDVQRFPFLEAPEPKLIRDGYKLLEMLGAINQQRLTRLGKLMARLPIDPRLGKILIQAEKFHALKELLSIISALNVGSLWEGEAPLKHPQSDFMVYLQIWKALRIQKANLSHKAFKKWCDEQRLSLVRVFEWLDVYQQLLSMVQDHSLRLNQVPASYAQIHQALLSGFIDCIGLKLDDKSYQGARTQFVIHPGSVIKKMPNWVMGAQLLHTSRVFLSQCAQIQPEWIVKVAPSHLIKHQYTESHYEAKSGRVVAFESLWLFGLPIQGRRKVNFENIQPKVSREIFIREGLMNDGADLEFDFFKHNQGMMHNARYNEGRIRHKRILVDEQQCCAFYDHMLDASVTSLPTLAKWLNSHNEAKLYFPSNAPFFGALTATEQSDFPDTLRIDAIDIQCEYRFELDEPDDGVTFCIPRPLLSQCSIDDFSFLVPGLVNDKIELVLRQLEKHQRRKLIPFEQNINKIIKQFHASHQRSFLATLQNILKRDYGIVLASDCESELDYPAYLKPHFKVILDDAEVVRGDDWDKLNKRFGLKMVKATSHSSEKNYLDWEFGDLPISEQVVESGVQLIRYIALHDNGNGVNVQSFLTQKEAEQAHQQGLIRLFLLRMQKINKQLIKQIESKRKRDLVLQRHSTLFDCWDDWSINCIVSVYLNSLNSFIVVRSRECFEQLLDRRKADYIAQFNQLHIILNQVSNYYAKLQQSIKSLKAKHAFVEPNIKDINQQLKNLLFLGFVRMVPYVWLQRYPTYFQALSIRCEKLLQHQKQDQKSALVVNELEKKLCRQLRLEQNNFAQAAAQIDVRWHLEELRISLFSQQLRTKLTVSPQRVRKAIDTLSIEA